MSLRGALLVSVLAITMPAPLTAQASSLVAPPTLVRTVAGDSVRIAGDAPTLVVVFATWCRSCRDEVATFNALHGELGARGVRLVALSADEIGDERVHAWGKRFGARYPMARDSTRALLRRYAVVGVPEAHLLAADGRVVWSHRGPIASALPALRKQVETLSPRRVTHSPNP